jgi:hypothetical protein
MVNTNDSRVGLVRALVLAAVFAVTVSACSDDDSTSGTPPPLPTPPTTSSDGSSVSTAADTTATMTNSGPSTTGLNTVPTTPEAPSTTSTTAVTAPPVTTLVPEVDPELLTREQRNPKSVNNSRPILPEHVPVIEAYLRGIQAATLVSSTWPINPEAPELVEAPFTPAVLRQAQEAARGRLDRGEVLNVDQGVTFRPYVVGPVTDTATVLDCELAGHYWTKVDTGELLPPNEIWPAGPGRIVEVGTRETFVLRGGEWLLDASQIDPGACG